MRGLLTALGQPTDHHGATRLAFAAVVAASIIVPLEFSTIGLVSDGIDIYRWGALAGIVFAVPAIVLPRRTHLPLARVPFAGLLLVGVWCWLSTIWSVNPRQSLLQGAAMIGVLLFSLATVELLGWRRWVDALLIGWGIFFTVGLALDAADGGLFTERATGLAVAATNLATMAAITIFLCIERLLSGRAHLGVVALGIVAGVSLAASGTRSPVAALALAVVAYIALTRLPSSARPAGLAAAIAGFAMIISWSLGRDELARVETNEDLQTFTGRSFIWDAITNFIAEQPWIGHGYASSPELLREAARDGEMPFVTTDAHNLTLQLLNETGLVGLVFFLAFAAPALVLAYRSRPELFALLLMLLGNGLVESLIQRPGESVMLFAVIAASLAVDRTHRIAPSASALGPPVADLKR